MPTQNTTSRTYGEEYDLTANEMSESKYNWKFVNMHVVRNSYDVFIWSWKKSG